MALTPERIRELWENYSPTKGIESFARSVEAEARRDALEEAAKVCESRQTPGTGSVAILNGAADAIRKLKEDMQ